MVSVGVVEKSYSQEILRISHQCEVDSLLNAFTLHQSTQISILFFVLTYFPVIKLFSLFNILLWQSFLYLQLMFLKILE